MTNTRACLIGYKPDYDVKSSFPKKKQYQISTGGVRNYYDVAIADGVSAEFLMTSCYDKLDDVIAVLPNPGWTGVDKFRELQLCLEGDAKSECQDLIAHDFPTDQDKNDNQAFELLKRDLITKLADHTFPGDKVHTYLSTKVQYRRCKKEDGRFEEPTKVLARLQRIRKLGARMHHNHGAAFMPDDEFTRMFWHIFPEAMKDWLVEDQNKDPFDNANPMDADEIADDMQRYWNLHYKRAKPQDSSNSNNGNKRDRNDGNGGNDDSGSPKKKARGRRNQRGGGGNDNNGGGGGGGKRENCSIKGHEGFRHDWSRCFLNPENQGGYDHDAAKDFYHNKTDGANAWYQQVYRAQFNQGNGGGRGYNQGGRGNGNGGRGGGRGRGGRFQGGRGRGGYNNYQGGRGGYQQNEQGQGNQGYHYQYQDQGTNGNQQGYHDGYGFQQQQSQQQQGPPTQQQQGPQAPSRGNGVSFYFGPPQGSSSAPMAPRSSYAQERTGSRRF